MGATGLVCFVPDPYLAIYFRRLFEGWKSEVDGLLVQVNGERREPVDFIADLYKDQFVIKHYHHSNQGIAFDELYKHFDNDILLTLCSDNFIYDKTVISELVGKLKDYDVAGSGGLHVRPPEMADKIAKKLGTCRINPFMSAWRADKLKQIEPFTFQSVIMPEGSEIIGMKYSPEGWLDCMTEMTIKFLDKGFRAFIQGADNPPRWIHASGLSSGVYGHLIHSDGLNMGGTGRNHFDSRLGMAHLAWWWSIYETTVDKCPLRDFNNEYYQALIKKIELCGVSLDQVKKYAEKFRY